MLGFFLALPRGLRDLSSPNRDGACAPCSGSRESQPLDRQGIPRHAGFIFMKPQIKLLQKFLFNLIKFPLYLGKVVKIGDNLSNAYLCDTFRWNQKGSFNCLLQSELAWKRFILNVIYCNIFSKGEQSLKDMS